MTLASEFHISYNLLPNDAYVTPNPYSIREKDLAVHFA